MSSSPSHLVLATVSADVWHAHALAAPVARVVATGESALDAQLPGGGWPVGALTELLQPPGLHAEWRLLASALARSGTAAVVLVAPPYTPFASALAARGVASPRLLWVHTLVAAQRLWSTEQALRCSEVDAVLAWLPHARPDQLRRLQMAASEYSRLLFVMRPSSARQESSPAVLRLAVEPCTPGSTVPAGGADTLQVHIHKRRGPPLDQAIVLSGGHSVLTRVLAAAQAPWLATPAEPQAAFSLYNCALPRDFHALDRVASRA